MRNLLLFMFALLCTTQVQAQNCNAAASTSVNGNVVTLTNTSTPTASTGVYTYYSIKWGDGSPNTTASTNASQVHTYTNVGTYVITLYQSVLDSTKNPPTQCNDSVLLNVTINGKYISGDLIVDSTGNLDSYMVWLITYDSATSTLAAVDSIVVTTIAGSGSYKFNNPAPGQYRTKAALHNGPTSGTGHVPTYHTSSLMWNTATLINYTAGATSGKNIVMQKGTLTTGPGFVGGNVNQGANKGTASGIEGLDVFLMNANNKPVAFSVTDANGYYSFSNLPVGSYKVHPENMNFATTAAAISITSTSPTFNSVNFERSLSKKTIVPVTSGISNVNNAINGFAVYPNPAQNVVTISWSNVSNQGANIAITDISGKVVVNTTADMNKNAEINISNLQAGLYFVTVATDAGNYTQKLVVQ